MLGKNNKIEKVLEKGKMFPDRPLSATLAATPDWQVREKRQFFCNYEISVNSAVANL